MRDAKNTEKVWAPGPPRPMLQQARASRPGSQRESGRAQAVEAQAGGGTVDHSDILPWDMPFRGIDPGWAGQRLESFVEESAKQGPFGDRWSLRPAED